MNALVIAFTALASLQLGGDPAPRPSTDAPVAVAENPDPADKLAAEAYRLFENRRTWPKAARLLEQSAELRDIADPERAATFLAAGRVYIHVGAKEEARRAFEAAADAAVARGAVSEAAHAFLDAAIVAAQTGDRIGAEDLISRGALLAESPHLQAREKDSIRRRIPTGVATAS